MKIIKALLTAIVILTLWTAAVHFSGVTGVCKECADAETKTDYRRHHSGLCDLGDIDSRSSGNY